MSWSPAFLAHLEQPEHDLIFLLESTDLRSGSVGSGLDNFEFSSIKVVGATHTSAIVGRSGGAGIGDAAATWQLGVSAPSRGSWSVQLALTSTQAGALMPALTRGLVVQLRAGWIGLDVVDYERVAAGCVRQLSFEDGVHTLIFDDLPGYLDNGFPPASPVDGALFGELAATSTTLTAAYSTGDAVLHVASTTYAAAGPLGYIVRVEPSGGADPFYLSASSKTTTSFTGCALFSGTDHAAASGSVAQAVAADREHPMKVALRILQSGATGATYDDYPDTWGFKAGDDWVDVADSLAAAAIATPSPSTAAWQLLAEEPVNAPESWLSAWLSPGGFFLTSRQGKLTVRSWPDPENPTWPVVAEIGLSDLQTVRWSAWHEDQPSEPHVWQVVVGSTTYSLVGDPVAGPRTLPSTHALQVDMSSQLAGDPADVVPWTDEVLGRMGPWHTRIAEVVTGTLTGLAWAELACGDVVELNLPLPIGLASTALSQGYTARKAVISSVKVNWFAATVEVQCLVRPLS